MILEFAGVPGCGKTTIESLLMPRLQERGLRFISRRQLERMMIAARAPVATMREAPDALIGRTWLYSTFSKDLFKELVSGGGFSTMFSKVTRSSVYWLLKDKILSSFFLSEVELLTDSSIHYAPSEGLVQHAAATKVWCGSGIEKFMLKHLEEAVLRRLTIVYLTVPPDLGFQRLQLRGAPTTWPKPYNQDREACSNIFERFDTELSCLIQKCREKKSRVIELDASNDAATTVENILKHFSA